MKPMFTPDEMLSVKASPVLAILGQCFRTELQQAHLRAAFENIRARRAARSAEAARAAAQLPKPPSPPPEPTT